MKMIVEFVRLTIREHSDDSVVVLDKLTYAGNERNLDPVRHQQRFRFVRGDICDQELVRDLAGQVDAIVNLARRLFAAVQPRASRLRS